MAAGKSVMPDALARKRLVKREFNFSMLCGHDAPALRFIHVT
jgi:hypothetical protein